MFRVVILGQGDTLTSVIKGLLESNSQIAGVFCWEDTKKFNLNRIFSQNPQKELLKRHNIKRIKAKSANSKAFKEEILRLSPDLILVSTWGELIGEDIIKIPKIACVNIHPSLLPKYRGPNPYSRVIMNNEEKTGITFHLMDKDFDTGAILLQKEVKITEIDDYTSLKAKICREIKTAATEFIDRLDKEIIIPVAQDNASATYFSHPSSEEIIITPAIQSAKEISRKIRALTPVQSCYIELGSEFIRIKKWKISDTPERADLRFKTADARFLLLYKPEVFGRFKKYFSKIILKFLPLEPWIK